MKKYVNSVRHIALKFFETKNILMQRIANIEEKYRKNDITEKQKIKQIAEVNELMSDLLNKFTKAHNDMKSHFNDAVDAWSTLDGKNIPSDDIKLFSGIVELKSDDLTKLSEKHKNNIVMQRAINEYAKKHDVNYDKSSPLPEDMIAGYASLCDIIQKAAHNTGSMHRAFVEDDKQFENILSPALKFDIDIK